MNSQNRTETDSQIQKTNWWFVYQWREGTEKGQCSGGGKAQTIQYKIGSSHIIQHREYSQYFAVTVNGK